MLKVQLQIKLKRNFNNINNHKTLYDIKEFRSDPKKCKDDIENFINNNTININNWNAITNKIITILKNNYPNKSSNKNNKLSEYTKEIINKQTQVNYEIFGHKKKLLNNNNNLLMYKVFKAWKQTNLEGNNNNNPCLLNCITKRKTVSR